ncbi:MAG: hypothetical protein AAFR59_12255, partial [Bacteroidota bacterium]
DGSIDLTVTSTNTSLSYLWSTGDTTEDLNNLNAGTYTVWVSDGQCTRTEDFEVRVTGVGTSGNVRGADCDGENGEIDLFVFGGTPPYSILWSTGDTIQNLTGLDEGGYSVTVTDADGCQNHEVFLVEKALNCTNDVTGKVYVDANGNCTYDLGEQILQGFVSTGNGQSQYVDILGNFDIDLPAGTYSLTHSLSTNPAFDLNTCLPTGQHTLTLTDSDSSGLDFAYEVPSPINDLAIYITQSVIRPGFDHTYYVHVKNEGTTPIAPTIFFNHDSLVTYLSHTGPGTYFPTNREVIWNPAVMNPGQELVYEVEANLPPSVPLGTILDVFGKLDPFTTDDDQSDNIYGGTATVVGSFDPNDKLVSKDTTSPGLRALTYTVRFQNTGTFPAEFVVLRDTLADMNLDLTTLKPVGASHPYEMELNGNELVVTFNNINLPDSASNPEGSNGYFMFNILLKENLPLGTLTQNRAGIYFDFNAPIITNYATTVLALRVNNEEELRSGIEIFPNPSTGIFQILQENIQIYSINVHNLMGQLVEENVRWVQGKIDLS